MIFTIKKVLTSEELQFMQNHLENSQFIDGKVTAGWHAKLVKNNTQIGTNSEIAQQGKEIINKALKRHPLFQGAVFPRMVHSIIFSRYESGMSYGRHIDNALMGGESLFRADISFTLFLNSPDHYQGGELVIEEVEEERSYKLDAGSMIVYPASTLHRVETVTKGVRLVAVGWVQSLIRNPQDREILFDLDTARRSIFAKEQKSIEFDLLSKSYANLLRKWMD